MAKQATDTFVMELDGIPRQVTKGAVFSDSDPLVRHDAANGGLLFAPLDLDGDAPAKSAPAKVEAKTQMKAEAKVSGKGGA